MLALPNGPPETAGMDRSPPRRSPRWPGRNGARCSATAIGPMPGPPPPWGMPKVLCRLMWQTSAPITAGLVESDLGVQVGPVHVHLAAVLVDQGADVADADSSNTPWVEG